MVPDPWFPPYLLERFRFKKFHLLFTEKGERKKQERRYLENPGLLIQNPGGGPSIKIVRFIGKDGGTGGIQSGESN